MSFGNISFLTPEIWFWHADIPWTSIMFLWNLKVVVNNTFCFYHFDLIIFIKNIYFLFSIVFLEYAIRIKNFNFILIFFILTYRLKFNKALRIFKIINRNSIFIARCNSFWKLSIYFCKRTLVSFLLRFFIYSNIFRYEWISVRIPNTFLIRRHLLFIFSHTTFYNLWSCHWIIKFFLWWLFKICFNILWWYNLFRRFKSRYWFSILIIKFISYPFFRRNIHMNPCY